MAVDKQISWLIMIHLQFIFPTKTKIHCYFLATFQEMDALVPRTTSCKFSTKTWAFLQDLYDNEEPVEKLIGRDYFSKWIGSHLFFVWQ